MKKVSIIGLGWLGEAAGLLLQKQGYRVLGSSTRSEKVELLREKGLDAVHFALDPHPKGTDYQRLFDSEILVVTLPHEVGREMGKPTCSNSHPCVN
jgi:predicted dinucleotide-binding enzyme